MRELLDFTVQDLGAILYQHYLDNYCEDDFSFDNGKLRKEIKRHLNSIKLTDDELDVIEDKIILNEEDGTDYETLNFKFKEVPKLFLQVTSMFDYNGTCCSEEYNGRSQWADVGMFFYDYKDYNFQDLRTLK